MALFKKKKDYFFESFVELANYAKEAFLILEEGLKDFNASKAEELKNNVHLVEHKADLDKREIEEKLAKEFITPIEVPMPIIKATSKASHHKLGSFEKVVCIIFVLNSAL